MSKVRPVTGPMRTQPVGHTSKAPTSMGGKPTKAPSPKQKASARTEAVRVAKAKIMRRNSLRKQREALRDLVSPAQPAQDQTRTPMESWLEVRGFGPALTFQSPLFNGFHSNRSLAFPAFGACSFLRNARAERHSAVQRSPRSHSSASLRSKSAMALSPEARASLRYRTARALLMVAGSLTGAPYLGGCKSP